MKAWISSRKVTTATALLVASCSALYFTYAYKVHSPSRDAYVIVDAHGQRLSALFDPSSHPPAEQIAFFKKNSPYFGKIQAGSCPLNRAVKQSWWTKITTQLSSLLNTTVHAQSCVPSYYLQSYCPNCLGLVCSGNGPGCAQLTNGDCLCYTVQSCSP